MVGAAGWGVARSGEGSAVLPRQRDRHGATPHPNPPPQEGAGTHRDRARCGPAKMCEYGSPLVGAGRRGGSRGREKGARCFRANEIGMVRPPALTRPHKRGRGPIGTVRDAARLRCVNTVAPLWGRAGEGGRAMRWRSGRSLIAGLNFIGRIRIERANRNGSARPPTLALPHHSPSKDGRSAERPLGGGDAP